MSTVSGSLITRNYANFKGVDFTDEEVSLTRSPDALNIWKDYKQLGKCIESRPELELVNEYDNTIWGVFFYKVGNKEMKLVHCGTKLYRELDGERTELFTGLNPRKSYDFVDNNIWYLKDGINYLKYDGETLSQVEDSAFIPTTTISRNPLGGGTTFQDVNMMSAYRKNSFVGDGESKVYHLDTKGLDTGTNTVTAVVDGTILNESTDFEVNRPDGIITFKVAPNKPLTDGQDNVEITFKKTVTGYVDRIKKCTLLQVFDNRVFFSGNQDYPNTVWHSSLNDPTYCSDLDYYNEGLDLSPVKDMVAGNNALWVFKEPSQANTTIFYHNPTIDSEYGKVYPSTHSSISTGCIGKAINFSDDICFFSDRGMEAVTQDLTTEQALSHRSSLIDSKLLAETNYKNMILEEWEGYLLVIIDNKVYLADSRGDETSAKYEWFYWELPVNVTCTRVKDGVLYLGTNNAIYKFGYDENEYKEVTFTEENGEYVLYGESTQATTNGYQLFDSSKLPTTTHAGVTITNNNDGSLSISGKGTLSEAFEVRYFVSHEEFVKLFKVGKLNLKTEKQTNPFIYVNLYKNGVFSSTILTNRWTTSASFEIKQEHLDEDYSLYIGFNGAASTEIAEGTIKPMLYQDGNGTWERFTGGDPNPTPDYPSEIVNTYKAGKYRTLINGVQYRFELKDDLRSTRTAKDRIYLDSTGLHITRNVNKILLDSTKNYSFVGNAAMPYFYVTPDNFKGSSLVLSDYFPSKSVTEEGSIWLGVSALAINVWGEIDTLEEFRTWIATHNTTVHYELATSTTTDIDYLVSPLSYWTTPLDEFNYPQYQKTTNKRGCVTDIKGTNITISTRIDSGDFEDIVTHENIDSYVVNRIKKKKWKRIQLRFSSHRPFELYSSTLESYVGGYVKR